MLISHIEQLLHLHVYNKQTKADITSALTLQSIRGMPRERPLRSGQRAKVHVVVAQGVHLVELVLLLLRLLVVVVGPLSRQRRCVRHESSRQQQQGHQQQQPHCESVRSGHFVGYDVRRSAAADRMTISNPIREMTTRPAEMESVPNWSVLRINTQMSGFAVD